jgi:hypothetical protein
LIYSTLASDPANPEINENGMHYIIFPWCKKVEML